MRRPYLVRGRFAPEHTGPTCRRRAFVWVSWTACCWPECSTCGIVSPWAQRPARPGNELHAALNVELLDLRELYGITRGIFIIFFNHFSIHFDNIYLIIRFEKKVYFLFFRLKFKVLNYRWSMKIILHEVLFFEDIGKKHVTQNNLNIDSWHSVLSSNIFQKHPEHCTRKSVRSNAEQYIIFAFHEMNARFTSIYMIDSVYFTRIDPKCRRRTEVGVNRFYGVLLHAHILYSESGALAQTQRNP